MMFARGQITPKQHSFQSAQLQAREAYLQSRMPQQASQPKVPAPDFTPQQAPQQSPEDQKANAQKEHTQVQGNYKQINGNEDQLQHMMLQNNYEYQKLYPKAQGGDMMAKGELKKYVASMSAGQAGRVTPERLEADPQRAKELMLRLRSLAVVPLTIPIKTRMTRQPAQPYTPAKPQQQQAPRTPPPGSFEPSPIGSVTMQPSLLAAKTKSINQDLGVPQAPPPPSGGARKSARQLPFFVYFQHQASWDQDSCQIGGPGKMGR
jgi:hypothetical protein